MSGTTANMLDRTAAHRVLEAAVAAAAPLGRPICVAVTDERGALLAFTRMDGAPVRSVRLSEAKAYSAARLGVSTTEFHERLLREGIPATYFADPMLTGLPGGAVIRGANEAVIGAIGISGLAPSDDQRLANEAAQQAKVAT
jgi:glc operon protein GlcG